MILVKYMYLMQVASHEPLNTYLGTVGSMHAIAWLGLALQTVIRSSLRPCTTIPLVEKESQEVQRYSSIILKSLASVCRVQGRQQATLTSDTTRFVCLILSDYISVVGLGR